MEPFTLPVSQADRNSATTARIGAITRARRWLCRRAAASACGGLLLFGASLLGLPLSTTHLAQFEALNRELGKLCGNPPHQAINVCRLHARLINGL
ncbi:MAG: hypothetical protein ACKOZT_07875 [Cyanobium sp.]